MLRARGACARQSAYPQQARPLLPHACRWRGTGHMLG